MAKEGVKFLYGSALVIGVVAVMQYYRRQKRLLKDICVSNTNFDWKTVLSGLLNNNNAAAMQGIPLQLSVVNNSNIDVTIKDIDLDVSVDGVYLGYVTLANPIELKANAESNLDLYITLDVGDWISLGIAALGSNVYKVRGNFVISASVFETLTYPYLLIIGGPDASEISGECEVN